MATILVVDDEEDVRGLLADHFAGTGYTVLEAADGDDALQCVRRHRPDLVLLDIRLPGMDGIEAFRRIRREDPGVGVIMITGYEDTDLLQSTLQAGAIGYFLKPFDLAALDQAVRSTVERFASSSERRWLAITVGQTGGAALVVPEGNLDSVDAERMKRVLGLLIDDGHSRVVVDLSGVVYIDSAGLGALIAAMKQARAAGGDLKLCGLQSEIRSILDMTGLSQRISVHGSRDEAIASWR